MAFLAELQGNDSRKLKKVPREGVRDRSVPNVALAGKDVLDDEADRWRYFFDSGCEAWITELRDLTFPSASVALHRDEAATIIEHWANREAASALGAAEGTDPEPELQRLEAEAITGLSALQERMDLAVRQQCAKSTSSLAFVKLSTRSPKDSKKAFAKAAAAYKERIIAIGPASDNDRWGVLSEEVGRAGAVSSGAEGLSLLLDSARVFEDLEYALRGPKDGGGLCVGAPGEFRCGVVARAWDQRVTPQREFRGIAWGGRLTCLCQYFHPLFYEGLPKLADKIAADCQTTFALATVAAAVQNLGGHCIIDFAWLGPGDVMIIELNPFDGVCLGTFPASTGLFLWDDAEDQKIMRGDAPFQMRVRHQPLGTAAIKAQCCPQWREVIYGS